MNKQITRTKNTRKSFIKDFRAHYSVNSIFSKKMEAHAIRLCFPLPPIPVAVFTANRVNIRYLKQSFLFTLITYENFFMPRGIFVILYQNNLSLYLSFIPMNY